MRVKHKFCFTKAKLQKLPIPAKRQIYYDAYQSGLALLITYGGSKTFYLYKTINHKTYIIKIGAFDELNIEDARNRVYNMISDIKSGKNQSDDSEQFSKNISLGDFFFNQYRPKHLEQYTSPAYTHGQTLIFNNRLNELKNKPLNQITREDIEKLHIQVGHTNGFYASNRMLALLKHMLNTAIDWGYININPAARIRLYKETARDRFIQPTEMSKFMDVLSNTSNHKLRDYIMLLLLTGQRGCNIRALKWSNIDFYNNILYLPCTKNGEAQRIPLTDQAITLLKQMQSQRISSSDWIFPSKTSKSGHLENIGGFWYKILSKTGIKNLRMHDLRRTMGSYQAINGTSLNIIGKSLGHKSIQATTIYARLNLNPVRESMQKATDDIFKFAKIK